MVRLVSLKRNLGKICLGLILAVSMAGCVDKSKYQMSVDPEEGISGKVANSFDFSTVQNVNLSVDYSAFKTYGPVFFGIYTENPFIEVEGEPDPKGTRMLARFMKTIQNQTVNSMPLWNCLLMRSICILQQVTSSLV